MTAEMTTETVGEIEDLTRGTVRWTTLLGTIATTTPERHHHHHLPPDDVPDLQSADLVVTTHPDAMEAADETEVLRRIGETGLETDLQVAETDRGAQPRTLDSSKREQLNFLSTMWRTSSRRMKRQRTRK